MIKYFWLLSMLLLHSVAAEIELVTVNWTPLKCQDHCIDLLEKEFRKVHAIENVIMNQSQGMAVITWKKGIPFSSVSVKNAMKMIGLSFRNIRVKAKGVIKHSGDNFYLISEGDHTSFELINPVVPDLERQTPNYNQKARFIRPELKNQLLQAERSHQIATIEGPLFMPERSPALVLTIESLNLENPKD